MLTVSHKISNLLKTIIFHTTKSKRTTTPTPFNNPRLTPRGIITKQPRQYDYNLPDDLPNRSLYWNRSVQNKAQRVRYNKQKLNKLMLNPIHEDGKRVMKRQPSQIIAQLTSLKVIKNSIGRTLVNLHEAIAKFPNLFLQNGPQADAFNFAMKEIHDRHLPTLNFYKFSTYCQLRYLSKLPPTEALMLHFFRHLEAQKVNGTNKISIERLAELSNYIFSREYPNCQDIMHKKPVKFELFSEGEYKFITFEDIVPNLYAQEQLKQIKSHLNDKIANKLKAVAKMPGGSKLIQKINSI